MCVCVCIQTAVYLKQIEQAHNLTSELFYSKTDIDLFRPLLSCVDCISEVDSVLYVIISFHCQLVHQIGFCSLHEPSHAYTYMLHFHTE